MTSADTALNFGKKNNNQDDIEQVAEVEIEMPPYEIRSQFRPKLMEFFNTTNMKNGAYIWAEQKTKEYFETAFGIQQSAWDYRNN